jgi:hypothetical protein
MVRTYLFGFSVRGDGAATAIRRPRARRSRYNGAVLLDALTFGGEVLEANQLDFKGNEDGSDDRQHHPIR